MKKLFAILLTVALFATNAVIVLANGYEDTNEEYEYENEYTYDETDYDYTEDEDYADIVLPDVDLDFGWRMPDWDREFDNLLDELIFRQFGAGSEFLFDYATEIGQTFAVGQFEIEVVGAIAFEGRRFGMTVWDWPEELEWDEETGEIIWPVSEAEVREVTYFTEIESYVFVAIRDLRGEIDMQRGVDLELARELDEHGWFTRFSWSNPLLVVRETDRAYFAIQMRSDFEEVPQQVDISFALEYFLADFVWDSDFAGIDFAALLADHEATFVIEDVYAYFDWEEPVLLEERWGFVTPQLAEIMGADFDPLSTDFEVMATGELSIRLAEGHYLTNIALTDDVLLRIQMTEPAPATVRRSIGAFVQLVDTRLEAEQNALWEEWDASMTAWLAAGHNWEDFDSSRFIDRQGEIEAARVRELFSIDLIGWWDMDSPRVNEIGYFINDMDLLNHLDFLVNTSDYETQVPIPFSFSGNAYVLDFGVVEFPGTHRVFIHDRYTDVSDVSVSLMGISFEVQDTAYLADLHDGLISVFDMFEIEFITADGEVLQDLWFGGAGWSKYTQHYEDEYLDVSWFSFDFFIDVREVIGVRINGTEIRTR